MSDEKDEVKLEEATGFNITSQVKSAKKEDEGIVVHVHGIDEKPAYFQKNGQAVPVTITVAGEHSDHYRRAEAAIRKRKLKPKSLTGQVSYDDNIEKIAACTLAWEGFYSERPGNPELVEVPMTQENAKQVYKACPWVLEQVILAMTDHASFFETESKTPSSIYDTSHDS